MLSSRIKFSLRKWCYSGLNKEDVSQIRCNVARLVLKGLESRARRIEQVEIHRLLAKYQYIFLKRLVAYQTDTNTIAVTILRFTCTLWAEQDE